jgi:hypothetical protein
MLVPDGGEIHRTRSDAGRVPTQIFINNDNAVRQDERDGHRRSSYALDESLDLLRLDERRDRSRLRDRERELQLERQLLEQERDRAERLRIIESTTRVTRERSRSRRRPSRSPDQYEHDLEIRDKMRRLERYEKEKEAERLRKEIEAQEVLEAAKREREKREEEERLKHAVQEFQAKEAADAARKKKEQEEEEERAKHKMREMLRANGYSDEEIDRMEKGKKTHSHTHVESTTTTILSRAKPVYQRVSRSHLDPGTLDFYNIPWEYDSVGFRITHAGFTAAFHPAN